MCRNVEINSKCEEQVLLIGLFSFQTTHFFFRKLANIAKNAFVAVIFKLKNCGRGFLLTNSRLNNWKAGADVNAREDCQGKSKTEGRKWSCVR